MSKSPFLEHVSEIMFQRRYSKRTIESYCKSIRAFINFHNQRHPKIMGEEEVISFVNYICVDRKLSVSSQSLALNALFFVYREIVKQPLKLDLKFIRSRRQPKLPVVMTEKEIRLFFAVV